MSTIYNTITGAAVTGTADADSIDNLGNEVSISAGYGNDTITNYSSNNSLYSGKNVTINAGADDDSIANHGANVYIDGEGGDDVINNSSYGTKASIRSGSGNDSIKNSGTFVLINAEDGNDTVTNTNLGANSTIIANDGDDYIITSGANFVSITGDKGNDTIYSTGVAQGVTLNGGAGDDTLVGDSVNTYGVLYQYANGTGDDKIYNYNSNDTISILNFSGASDADKIYNTLVSGNNVIVSLTAGSITLVNAKDKTLNISGGIYAGVIRNSTPNIIVQGTSRNDTIANYANGVNISTGGGNDLIENYRGDSVTIDGGAGDDSITHFEGDKVSVLGGAGNDRIINYADNAAINAGAGNDTVSLKAEQSAVYLKINYATVSGGAGNDFISKDTHFNILYQYSSGDGLDTLSGYNSNDTISIAGSANYETLTNGNNIIVSVGSGLITLIDAKGETLNIKGGKYAGGSSNTLPAGLSISGDTLTASTAFTGNTISAANYNVKNIKASELSKGIYIYGDANKNIILGGKGKDSIYGNAGNDFIYGGNGNDYIDGGSDNDLIYGEDGNDTLFGDDGNDTLIGGDGADFIHGEAGNDVLFGEYGNDTLNGGTGNDTLIGGSGADLFVYNGGNDIINDFSALNDKISLSAVAILNHSLKGSDLIFNFGAAAGNLTLKNTKNQEISIGSSIYYNNVVYDNRKTSVTVGAGLSGTLKASDYVSSVKNIYAAHVTRGVGIYGNTNANYIDGSYYNDTLYGGAGNDTVHGNAGNDKIYGNDGNDVLDGDSGNDTLYGGAGNDTFRYYGGEGNDVIADFESGDTIYLSNATISAASLKSSDMVFTVGKNTLTVKNGKNKEIAIGNYIYYNNLIYDSKKTRATLGAGFTGTLKADDYSSTVTFIDATAVKNGIYIYGNDKADYIYATNGADVIHGGAGNDYIYGRDGNDILRGGTGNDVLYGGEGNDLLDGDAGNDTLYGGNGNDTFRFYGGEGGGMVADYEEGKDKILVYSDSLASYAAAGFSDLTFSVGTGIVTVKNGINKEIAVNDKIFYNNFVYDSKKTFMTIGSTFNGTVSSTDYSSSIKNIYSQSSYNLMIYGNSNANIIYGNTGNDTIYAGAGNDYVYADSGNDYVFGDTGNDTLRGGSGNDTLFGGSGNDTLYGDAGYDVFRYSGGNDVIADFENGEKISMLNLSISSTSIKGSDVIFKIGSGTLTVKNGKGKDIVIDDKIYNGYLTYSSNKATVTVGAGFTGTLNSSDYDSAVKVIWARSLSSTVNIAGNDNANTIYGSTNTNSINGGAGNDFIYGGSGKDTFFGGAGNDTLNGLQGNDLFYGGDGNDWISGAEGNDFLNGNGGNDLIFGGNDNDTIWGDAGNDTLYGGSGNDVFCFSASSGADVIGDFEAGDSIKLYGTNASISSISVKGSDVVYKFGTGTITVTNGKNKDIKVGDKIYNNNFIYNSNKTEVTIGAGFSGSLNHTDYASTVTKVDASNLSSGITIRVGGKTASVTGSSYNDSIYNSTNNAVVLDGGAGNDRVQGYPGNDKIYGGAGNDSLYGGYGNDTLTGGAGNDLFLDDYGGNDVITDYTAGQDTIKFSHAITSTIYKNSDVIFGTSVGSFTVKDGKGKNITITDSSGKTTTKLYTNGVTARTLDLLEDTNFISNDTSLDSITEKKFAVTNIQSEDTFALAQDSSILAYSNEK